MRRLKPTTVFTALAYVIVGVLIVLAFINQQQRIRQAADDYQHLLSQYTKSVNDCSRANDCTSTVPAPSVVEGQAGQPGQNGTNGRDATDVQVFDAVRDYCMLRVNCQGPTGLTGTSGASGANGADGATGASGSDGATGAQGPQGDPGPAGANGVDGQPPFAWTYTDMLDVDHTCTRTDPFDPASPTYICN